MTARKTREQDGRFHNMLLTQHILCVLSKVKMKVHFNFIQKLGSSCLKYGCVPFRFQSSNRPMAPLGSRILTDPKRVYEHNMWDHMQWSQEEEELARKKAAENSDVRILLEDQATYDQEASKYWNEFYKTHKNNFFRDRNWLILEFPEIIPTRNSVSLNRNEETSWDVKLNATSKPSTLLQSRIVERIRGHFENHSVCALTSFQGCAGRNNKETLAASQRITNGREIVQPEAFPGSDATFRIFEVGCGAGNSVFPILKAIKTNPGVFLYCCDFAPYAVELLHLADSASPCYVFLHDVCDDASLYPFPDESLDVILLVFVLSSIHPDRMQGAISRLSKLLKPGGMLLFRDYGRYDLSQLRFKKGHCLSENFYVRGDGTQVYFFTEGETHRIFTSAGLSQVQNLVDRRLKINRKKEVKMPRVWIQSKFQKPFQPAQNKPEDESFRAPAS
ncbi:methyltransferase-like protein 8 isoform X1 [Rhinatrema bivittatum]|uniref:methyltransferase-like protein 8 isoform X1 n=1 Tax=Rhinatrema bivittatum TaxID=194408 RepID=UPI00112DF630|nr:methyltransferase-like protein 8 isoform X1 [Rhinatrema bivittatum]